VGKRPKEWHAGGKVSTKVSNELLNILKVEVGGNIRPGQYRDQVDPYPGRVPMPRGDRAGNRTHLVCEIPTSTTNGDFRRAEQRQ
jgi:hypothetical protein